MDPAPLLPYLAAFMAVSVIAAVGVALPDRARETMLPVTVLVGLFALMMLVAVGVGVSIELWRENPGEARPAAAVICGLVALFALRLMLAGPGQGEDESDDGGGGGTDRPSPRTPPPSPAGLPPAPDWDGFDRARREWEREPALT